jgi:uncharacterized protein YndB with AHSA1/START domain
VRIEFHVDVDLPPEEVFAYLADPRNATEWQDATVEVRMAEEEGAVEAGTQYEQLLNLPGKHVDATVEVTVCEPPHRFAIRSTGGPLDFHVEHTLEPAGDGTTVTVVAEGEAKGVFRFAGPLMAPMVQHGMKQDFETLKKLLEAR